MLSDADIDLFARKLGEATSRVASDYADGDVVGEEAFSDQLCGRLKETLVDFESPNVRWQADATFGDVGQGRLRMRSLNKHKEEPQLGADIVMVLDLDLPEYSVKKGLLAQAKRLKPDAKITTREWLRLRAQCEDMLAITPSSMVFLYSEEGVVPLTATTVLAYEGRDLHSLPTWDVEVLYQDFAKCWWGDPDIRAADPESLEALRIAAKARAAIRMIGRGKKRSERIVPSPYERARSRALSI